MHESTPATSPSLKIGQYLYASCADEDYGKVIGVGEDENKVPTIDIEVYNSDDLIDFDEEINALTTIELPEGVNIILRKVQYELIEGGYIECQTPANNCYRCTKFFKLKEERTKWNNLP